MKDNKPSPLPIAVRVYPEHSPRDHARNKSKKWRRPDVWLVFDTETMMDATQAVLFGSYRIIKAGRCLEEGLFHADDLCESDRSVLADYVRTHHPQTVAEGVQQLKLITRREFVDKFFHSAYKSRALVIGFNLPFDLSRIAVEAASARGRFAGGFSLGLSTYTDEQGCEKENKYRPRIAIKHIDSKRALKQFTARREPDQIDLIPDGEVEDDEKRAIFRGHFLDLRTLAFALTDKGYSLDSACEAFGVENGKTQAAVHGIISEQYIDYNRRDVTATAELATKLLNEYDRHPIHLQETKAFSPASIGKAYLRSMGIAPILERQPEFPRKFIGYAQTAFFGGRTSSHIRKVPVPVIVTDFISMYPTVNSLMGLWNFVIAEKINVIEHCQADVQALLEKLAPDSLFHRETWKRLTAFVKVIPHGDVLPTRGKYSKETNDWQVALNHLSVPDDDEKAGGLWFSLPDVVASLLLTGRIPVIVDAFRIEASGGCRNLKATKLRGQIDIDSGKQDFFKVVIEERKRLSLRTDLTDVERNRLDKFLKVIANAASYGIYAEMNREEKDEKVRVICNGIDPEPFTCAVAHPEVPGEYCFPPMASLITGGARLMLALLEHSVTSLGGTYAMEDTDSMAICATKKGGFLSSKGGSHRTSEGEDSAMKALSWEQVDQIVARFSSLNPYAEDAVPGSILKIEDVNFEAKTHKQRQIYCFSISAKRYALFERDGVADPAIVFNSQHGLGHLLNPTDPGSDNRDWIQQVWLYLIRRVLALPVEPLPFESLPAVGRVSISSPAVMKAFSFFNSDKPYRDQMKPFNFILTCQIAPFGHPMGADPNHYHLIAPYESNPAKWLTASWIEQYTGTPCRITTTDAHGNRATARVKTYGDILREYEFHPESKCADAEGRTCDRQTVGLLQRRHVEVGLIKYIGKESNGLEEVDAGMIHSAQSVYTEYPDPRRDEWETKTLPKLNQISLSALEEQSDLARRTLSDIRAGRSRPHPKNRTALAELVEQILLGKKKLPDWK